MKKTIITSFTLAAVITSLIFYYKADSKDMLSVFISVLGIIVYGAITAIAEISHSSFKKRYHPRNIVIRSVLYVSFVTFALFFIYTTPYTLPKSQVTNNHLGWMVLVNSILAIICSEWQINIPYADEKIKLATK